MGDFQQMIQERLNKVEEIKNCLKLSAVSSLISNIIYLCNGVRPMRGAFKVGHSIENHNCTFRSMTRFVFKNEMMMP